MRTLKKTLALVLVLAMMFSLCAMSVSATDFKDDAKIENKLAVGTLKALGILDGMDGENFVPNGNLTRAQAAKIIAFLLGDGAEAAKKTATDFADVDKDYWASGYIAYCANLGIVEGYGDGTYGPEDQLTGYQWLKMLLCALGFDADVEGLNGIGWDVMTAIMAADEGLVKGIETLNKRNIISRDDAAQAAFNALLANSVYYEDGEYIPGTTYGECKDGLPLITLLGYTFDVAVKRDVYGRPEKAEYSIDTIVNTKDEAVVVYTEAIAAVKTATAETKVATIAEAAFGKNATYTVAPEKLEKSLNGDDLRAYDLTKYGEGKEVHNVKVYAYQLQLGDIVPAGYATKAYIKLDTFKHETTDAYAVGDVVLYTLNKAGDKVVEAKKADVAINEITSVTDINSTKEGFTLDGVAKELHGDALVEFKDIKTAYYADEDEYYFYTDAYGYVVAMAVIPETTPHYGFLTDYEYRIPGYAGDDFDLIENIFGAIKPAEKFEIVTPAGETVVYDGNNLKTGEFALVAPQTFNPGQYGLVTYNVTRDGKIDSISLVAEGNDYGFKQATGTLGNWTGNAYAPATTELVTSATVGFVYTETWNAAKTKVVDVTAEVYTGYLNIPSFLDLANYILGEKINSNNNYKAFSVNADDLYAVIKSDYVYVASETYTQTFDKVYINTYTDVYINGVKSAIKFADNDEVDGLVNAIQNFTAAGKYAGPKALYKMTYNAKGFVDAIEAVDPFATEEDTGLVYVIEDTYFKTTTEDGERVTYFDDATAFYQIVEDADGKQSIKVVDELQALASDICVYVGYVYESAIDADDNAEFVYFFVTKDALSVAKSEAVKALDGWIKDYVVGVKGLTAADLGEDLEDVYEAIADAETPEEAAAIANGAYPTAGGTGILALSAKVDEILKDKVLLTATAMEFVQDAALNSAKIKGLADGVYSFAKIPVLNPTIQHTTNANDIVFVKFATKATADVTLKIVDKDGKVVYTESHNMAAGPHFFYVQVLGSDVYNEGTGLDTALAAGTYKVFVTEGSAIAYEGSFSIG